MVTSFTVLIVSIHSIDPCRLISSRTQSVCRNVVNSIGPQPIVFLGRQMRDALFLRESHDRETESRPETFGQLSMIFGGKTGLRSRC